MQKLQHHNILFVGSLFIMSKLEVVSSSSSSSSLVLVLSSRVSSSIVNGTRRITADTALRLSLYFGNSPKFWLSLQDDFDIEEELRLKKKDFELIKKYEIQKTSRTAKQSARILFPEKLEKANELLRRVGVPEQA